MNSLFSITNYLFSFYRSIPFDGKGNLVIRNL